MWITGLTPCLSFSAMEGTGHEQAMAPARFAGWGGMLALTALAAASDEHRAQVQSLTLTATPPSYQQLVADRQQRVCNLSPANGCAFGF